MVRRWWLGIVRTNYARWTTAHGALPAPHGSVPRKHWRTRAERDGILLLHAQHPLDGYRALAYLMLDAGNVAVSPSSVYRVLHAAGVPGRWTRTPSKKGAGFEQPTYAHAHWPIDCTYINIAGTFYYVVCHSRWVIAVFRALGNARVDDDPRRLDHRTAGAGTVSQHTAARDLRQRPAIHRARLSGVHSRRRDDARAHGPVQPAVERQAGTLESNAESPTVRPEAPTSPDDARRHVIAFVHHYNTQRLHSAIGYITLADRLAGRSQAIWDTRDAGSKRHARRDNSRIAPPHNHHRRPASRFHGTSTHLSHSR